MYHLVSILREVKMFFLLFLFILQTVRIDGEQQSTIENTQFQFANETETSRNQTMSSDNNNQTSKTDMQRITQPIAVMGRNMMELKSSEAENTTAIENRLADFKPSPHLGSFYEHNIFPVKPAVAEAKTFGSHFPENSNIVWPDNNYNVPTWTEKQNIQSPYDYNIWTENPRENQDLQKLTTPSAPPWIQFPNAIPVPYQFVVNRDYPAGAAGGFAFNKPVQGSQTLPKATPSFWDRLLGFGRDKSGENKPNSQQKTFDYNLLETPPHKSFYELQSHHQGSSGYGGLGYPQLYGGYGTNPNPWKKIIKALATIIPIGLFISALTPTVITVSSTNDTSQSRYRLENSPQEDITGRLSSSRSYTEDGCEDRVLCELLVSASFSKNAERNIRNLLDNFVNQEDIQNKKENLLKIFEAVKNQNCSPILCGNMKNPT